MEIRVGRARGFGLWSVLAGTAVSKRVRGGHPNSVNAIRDDNGTCAIERFDHTPEHGFVLGDVVRIRLATGQPLRASSRTGSDPSR